LLLDSIAMRHAREAAVGVLVAMVLCSVLYSATATADPVAEAMAPSQSQTGGSEYGSPGRLAQAPHPVLSDLRVPTSATAGTPPKVTLLLQEQGVGTVYLQVKVINLATHHSSLVATMGWSHTGRTLTVAWPAGSLLAAGSYLLSVSVHDHHGRTLLRNAHASGEASLTVTAPAPPAPKPALPAPAPTPALPGVPTPAQTVADGAVFPVAGAHNFGGPENVFGAPRNGYLHQGQDILTAEGTPVLAPLAGTILTTSYQAAGAGYYAVEQTGIGFDFMFAHCQESSLAVSTGQAVTPGQALCKAGQTGDATAPHLDFEIWVGGWQAPGGEPIDPLPYLQAWAAA
jgi:murein DD-endopeptidase MepM/ murein hydrolase activator NlpD